MVVLSATIMKRTCMVLVLYFLNTSFAFHVRTVRFNSETNFRSAGRTASDSRILPANNFNLRRLIKSQAHTSKMHLSISSEFVSLADVYPNYFVVGLFEIWNRYEILLEQYPHAVDAATGVVLYFLGQIVSGLIIRQEVPPERLFRWMLFGSIDGFLTHDWYHAVDHFGDQIGGDGWGKPLFMIASDTLVYTPTYCFVFIIVMALLEGRGIASATQQVRTDLRELAQGSVSAWLPFNAAIYTVIPLRLRLPTAMMVHFLYSIGLSLWEVGALGHRPAADTAAHDAIPAADADTATKAAPPDPADPEVTRERRHEPVLDRRSVAAAAAAAATVVMVSQVVPGEDTAE